MALPQTRWTAAMVRALPDDGFRHEVVDGKHLVTPAPSWTHQRAVRELVRQLLPYLQQHGVGELLFAPADIEFDEYNMVEPDLFVLPRRDVKIAHAREDVRPLLLVVEVLSPSTSRTDYVRKRRLYQDHRVPEYWIVDIERRVIERAGEDIGTVFTERVMWQSSPGVPALSIELSDYFRDVTGESSEA